jgi:hypothetical protein
MRPHDEGVTNERQKLISLFVGARVVRDEKGDETFGTIVRPKQIIHCFKKSPFISAACTL